MWARLLNVWVLQDDEFRKFVDKVPRGCRITIVSDCCHSGGLIEAAKEQIGHSTNDETQNSPSLFPFTNLFNRNIEQESEEAIVQNRYLPISTLIDILPEKSDNHDIQIGKQRHTLLHMFGEDAGPGVKKFTNLVTSKQHGASGSESGGHRGVGLVGELAERFFDQKISEDYDEEHVAKRGWSQKDEHCEHAAASIKRSVLDCGVLLSGCQSDQTYGAFSNVIQGIIEETNGAVTNRELVLMAKVMLKRHGFAQKPGLYCSDNNVNAPFIC